MEFNKRYNRVEFVSFLGSAFLPEDFMAEATDIKFERQTKYIRSITKLGKSEKLDLVVYEVRHTSTHDARVGLSKEAFRFLADEWESRALVLFVPEDNDANYRFSLITIDLNETEEGRLQRIYSNPRRYSYYLGEGIAWYTPNKYLNTLGRVSDEKDLTERFSVEVLTKAFYQELSDWYAWAVKIIRFPNKLDDKDDDDKYNCEAAIRLVTRLIFVWFLKQKQLIPNEFFDEDYIRKNLIDGFNPNVMVDLFSKSNESKYYKAILQNLFFAMLNSPITKEGGRELSERHFRSGRGDYDNNKLMRYESYFKNPQLFVDLANQTVPFLNGGLFDCLDDKDNKNYVDGFSDREDVKKYLVVPDYLFFGEEAGKNIDLSEWYGDKKKKKVSARGIIDILKRYNFTVEENTPFDQEVSLDPELLGKVFENLLASYNPETQTTARKQTGSFYTPREIVQYMVDESLVAHLKRTVGEELEPEYRKLISYVDEDVLLTIGQKQQIMEAIYHCKVLDPACGSGAFPVGILQQMVHILSQLDPTNEQWKNMMLEKAINESRHLKAESPEEFKERMKDIEDSFDENLNNPDYARKLYLIENCIYGVDIQPIAIQISKLRFFISLVVDQKTNTDPINNFGIRPLPNLEAKFVAANALIPLEKDESNIGRTPEIVEIESKLKEANHKIFSAKTVRTKRKWKKELIDLRSKMAEKLADNGFLTTDAANQLASWDMFNQNTSSSFFDPDWMFGVKDGFDVAIGNPPYVEFKNLAQDTKKLLVNYKSTCGKYDLYIPFIEKASYILKKRGMMSYIMPTRFLQRDYGKAIRSFIKSNMTIKEIYDFGDLQVFNTAMNYTGIFFIENSKSKNYLFNVKIAIDLGLSNRSFYLLPIDSSMLDRDKWAFQQGNEDCLIEKISLHKPLSDFVDGIYQGIATGKDDVFVIDSATISLNKIERDIVHPFLKGKDIGPYTIKSFDRYVLYPYDSNEVAFTEQFISEKYPNAYAYLLRNRYRLAGRGYFEKSTKRWYELWNQRKLSRFTCRKLITLDNASKNSFTLDTNGYLGTTTVYSIILKDESVITYEFLLGVLNSKLLDFYHKRNTIPQAGGFYRYQAIFIKDLPIATPTKTIKSAIEELVINILSAKRSAPSTDTTDLENEIDFMVYKLYGLIYDEVLIVDPETSITRKEYENENGNIS